MYRADKAVIMAAGMGNRMRPVTGSIPKPLVKVHGESFIGSAVRALHLNGITEIYAVTGHLEDQFSDFAAEYGVELIRNPWYKTCNNISSLYAAREHLCNAMILDGDQLIRDPRALSPEFERSGYNAVWTDGHTDEWLMTVENEIVVSCSRTGGSGGWRLFSISRWSAADGEKLCALLKEEFEKNKRTDIYWDDIPLFLHKDKFRLGIKQMGAEDVTEIDTLQELAAADGAYKKYL